MSNVLGNNVLCYAHGLCAQTYVIYCCDFRAKAIWTIGHHVICVGQLAKFRAFTKASHLRLFFFCASGCRQKGIVGGEYLFPFAQRYFNIAESDSFLKTKKNRRSQSLEDVDVVTTPSSSDTLMKFSQ